MGCFASLSMTKKERDHCCHAEPFGFAQDKLREAESKHLIPRCSCVTSVSIVLLLLYPALVAAQSVFAAASLNSALSELTTHYEGMRLSVASSSTLAKQIAAGAPADIYFSANAEWMDYLQTRQHIEQDTRVDLLGNALVVIAPKEEPFAVRWAREFDFASALSLAAWPSATPITYRLANTPAKP